MQTLHEAKKKALRMSKKVCIVLTSRGNYAKFKRIIEILRETAGIDLVVITGGELVLKDRVVDAFVINPDYEVFFSVSGGGSVSMSKSVGGAISEFSTLFNLIKPDLICIVGDRFETLGVATAAYMTGIPIAHLEGGELSGTIDEGVRHAITKLASLHFPCTANAAKVIEQLGENPDNIYVVGSTSLDVLDDLAIYDEMMALQRHSDSGVIIDVKKPFLLVCLHPIPNEPEITKELVNETIKAINSLEIPTFWVNANLDAGNDIIGSALRKYRDQNKPSHIHFFKSLPIREYGYLLKHTKCMVGNSSAGIRECSFLGTPSVTIGDRQQHRQRDVNTMDAIVNSDGIIAVVDIQLEQKYKPSSIYGDGNASEKIVSYIRNVQPKRQKVFYEITGHYTGKGGQQRHCKQEHSGAWRETVIPMGSGHSDKVTIAGKDHHFDGYPGDPRNKTQQYSRGSEAP